MTSRQLYEFVLVELNKENAPSFLVSDFNYMINKIIYKYIEDWYIYYEMNEQISDKLRVLKAEAELDVSLIAKTNKFHQGVYETNLPDDYLHILNCMCEFISVKNIGCRKAGKSSIVQARKQTADIKAGVESNYYFRPSYECPYYYIHNVNTSKILPTNPFIPNKSLGKGTDLKGIYSEDNSNLSREISQSDSTTIDLTDLGSGVRVGNASTIRMEIKCGEQKSHKLEKVYVDYLKNPQHIRLTQEQIDLIEDTSQIMEFPDVVCHEIISELVQHMLEKFSDQRLQTNTYINQPAKQANSQQG